MDIGSIGITLDPGPDLADRVARHERLGISTLWIAGGRLDSLDRVGELITAARTTRVGTAIIPPDVYPAEQVARTYAELEATAPGRFLVGLGGPQQSRSLQALNGYLDHLDRPQSLVPVERRYLAALGPRKLALARDRFAGAITLLVTPAFTEQVRTVLGDGQHQIVQLPVVGDTDPGRARATARGMLGFLVQVPGYRTNLGRLGFTDTEVDRLDDRLVDAVVAWGDPETVAAAVRRHRDAGADQVIVNPLAASADFLTELTAHLGLPAA